MDKMYLNTSKFYLVEMYHLILFVFARWDFERTGGSLLGELAEIEAFSCKDFTAACRIIMPPS